MLVPWHGDKKRECTSHASCLMMGSAKDDTAATFVC